MKIKMLDFQGIAPVIDPKLLNQKFAMLCHNCNIDSGKLIPYWLDCSNWNWGGEQEVSSPVNEARIDSTYYIQDGLLYCKEPERRVYNAKPAAKATVEVTSALRIVDPTAEDHEYKVGDVKVYCYINYGGGNLVKATPGLAKNNNYENDAEELEAPYLTGNKSVFAELSFSFSVPGIPGWSDNYSESISGTAYKIVNFSPTAYIYFDRCTAAATNETPATFERIGAMTIMYEGASRKTSYIDVTGYDGENYARVKTKAVSSVPDGLPSDEWIEENTPSGKHLSSFTVGGAVKATFSINFAEQLETRSYLWTYVNSYEEESPNSDVGELIQCRGGDIVKVTINNIPATAKKVYLYRTGGSIANDTASFYFCKEFAVSSGQTSITSWTDKVKMNELAEEHFDIQNPPTGLFSLHKINGSLVAAQKKIEGSSSGKNVWFSEPYMPYDWDIAYNYTVEHEIIGIEVSGSSVFVLTKGSTVILRGFHPGNMSQSVISDDLPCESTQSITSADGLVYYASADGLVCVDESGKTFIATKDLIAKEQWQFLNPSTMVCAVQGKKVAIKCTAKDNIAATGASYITLLYDISNKTLTTQDYSSPASPVMLKWRSKVFFADVPFAMAAARVITTPATGASFRLLSVSRDREPDGAVNNPADFTNRPASSVLDMQEDRTVTNDNAFRLPKVRKELECFIEIDSTAKINTVELATSLGEIKYVGEQ